MAEPRTPDTWEATIQRLKLGWMASYHTDLLDGGYSSWALTQRGIERRARRHLRALGRVETQWAAAYTLRLDGGETDG